MTLLRPFAVPARTRAAKIMPCLYSEIQRSPELNRGVQKIVEPRRELMRQVLRRGMDAGELRADLDVDLVMAMLTGPLIAQSVVGWNPKLDRTTLPERLVDTLWPAIAAG